MSNYFIGASVTLLIIFVLFFLFKTKCSKPILFSFQAIQILGVFICFKTLFSKMKMFECVLLVLLTILLVAIEFNICRKAFIEFGNYQILSFSYLYNILIENSKNKDKKILGSVIPYSMNNLKFGGQNICFEEKNGRGGTMITGASGSGKSVQMMELIKQDIDQNRNIVFFDFKGEKRTSDEIKAMAKEKGYEIYSLDDEYMFSFDPLVDMSPTGRVETLLNTRKWSMDGADAHYRSNTQLLTQKYISAFDKYYEKHSIENESFPYTYNLYKFINANKPDLSNRDVASAYKTLVTLLEIILTSKLGPSLRDEYTRKFSFKKAADYNEKYVMIISIPSDSKEFANSISSFYFRNLMFQGTMSEYAPALSLYIDEFGSLENPFVIKDILEKGRSCGIMTTIAMQDIFQIVINTNEAYLNSLLGTINNFFIFAGATKEAAAKMAGVQIKEVEGILQTLMKPSEVSSPTACLITKIPILDKKKSSEVYKYTPYVAGMKSKNQSILSKGFKEGENESEIEVSEETSTDFDYNINQKQIKIETKKEIKKKDDDDFEDFLDTMGLM